VSCVESKCKCDECRTRRKDKRYRRQRFRHRWTPYSKSQEAMLSRLSAAVDGLLVVEWGKDSSRKGRGNGYGVWGQYERRAYLELRRMGYVADVTEDERNRCSQYARDYAKPYYQDFVSPEDHWINKVCPEIWEPHRDVRVIRLTTEDERQQLEAERKADREVVRTAKTETLQERRRKWMQSQTGAANKYKQTDNIRDAREFWGVDYDKWGNGSDRENGREWNS
jgi:hypothetical protein